MTLDAQPPGVDPQMAGLLALFTVLGGVIAKVTDALLTHVRKHGSTAVSLTSLQQREQQTIFEQSAELREELRQEIKKLQSQLREEHTARIALEQLVINLQQQVRELRQENQVLRQFIQRGGFNPPNWPMPA